MSSAFKSSCLLCAKESLRPLSNHLRVAKPTTLTNEIVFMRNDLPRILKSFSGVCIEIFHLNDRAVQSST